MMQLMKSNHAVHQIAYHIVFCTKYRQPVLTGAVEVETKRILGQICAHFGWTVKALEVMPDHVHIHLQTDHTIAPVRIVQMLKSISAVYLFAQFPTLKQNKFWGSGLRSKSTYYGTVGHVSEEIINRYIETQKVRR